MKKITNTNHNINKVLPENKCAHAHTHTHKEAFFFLSSTRLPLTTNKLAHSLLSPNTTTHALSGCRVSCGDHAHVIFVRLSRSNKTLKLKLLYSAHLQACLCSWHICLNRCIRTSKKHLVFFRKWPQFLTARAMILQEDTGIITRHVSLRCG